MITGGTLPLDGVCSGICGGSLGIILARRAALDQFFGMSISLGWFGRVRALFYLVWMLNFYNLVDGIACVERAHGAMRSS
jgi:UDP-N-acetylmuramyl pentapeptide phosphotransferase/UDP-N-acetylglucosamine-1-phosphate transferase